MTYRENRNNHEGSRRVGYPTSWFLAKMNAVVDSVSPDKGCEVLDGELNHE